MGRFKQKMPCYTGSLVDLEYIVYFNFLKTCQSTSGKGYIMAIYIWSFIILFCMGGLPLFGLERCFQWFWVLLKSVF